MNIFKLHEQIISDYQSYIKSFLFIKDARISEKVNLNVDSEGWRPELGKTDKEGQEIEDRVYNRKDFDKTLVIDERTQAVAKKLTEFLKGYDRFAKTIVFYTDIDHAERMRSAIANLNGDLVAQNHKYFMQKPKTNYCLL